MSLEENVENKNITSNDSDFKIKLGTPSDLTSYVDMDFLKNNIDSTLKNKIIAYFLKCNVTTLFYEFKVTGTDDLNRLNSIAKNNVNYNLLQILDNIPILKDLTFKSQELPLEFSAFMLNILMSSNKISLQFPMVTTANKEVVPMELNPKGWLV